MVGPFRGRCGASFRGMERIEFTQRMPRELAEKIDAYRATTGLSRAAAINILCALGLNTATQAKVYETAVAALRSEGGVA
jgi:hypothetical protein